MSTNFHNLSFVHYCWSQPGSAHRQSRCPSAAAAVAFAVCRRRQKEASSTKTHQPRGVSASDVVYVEIWQQRQLLVNDIKSDQATESVSGIRCRRCNHDAHFNTNWIWQHISMTSWLHQQYLVTSKFTDKFQTVKCIVEIMCAKNYENNFDAICSRYLEKMSTASKQSTEIKVVEFADSGPPF